MGNEISRPVYEYSSLYAGQIRLLYIYSEGGDMRYSLQSFDLGEAPEFIAYPTARRAKCPMRSFDAMAALC
jgi:hypothetical protein